jgi:hypothetical protein
VTRSASKKQCAWLSAHGKHGAASDGEGEAGKSDKSLSLDSQRGDCQPSPLVYCYSCAVGFRRHLTWELVPRPLRKTKIKYLLINKRYRPRQAYTHFWITKTECRRDPDETPESYQCWRYILPLTITPSRQTQHVTVPWTLIKNISDKSKTSYEERERLL